MSDHTLPTVTSNYTTLLTEFSNRIIDGMKMARSDQITITANLITTGYVRLNMSTKQLEEDTSANTTKTWTAIALNAATVTTNANLTGGVTSAGNAATVVTNANLTGPITSSGNATSIAAQTGTGTTFAMAASPTFTGTPITTTAAVDTNTTQMASTAYVIGQTYLKTATAASTYAPLASPTFTGIPITTTAAVDTNTTQMASTAYVIGQTYLKTATAASTYAPLASPTLTGTPLTPNPVSGTVEIGFRTIPQRSVSSAYGLVLADSGVHILHPSADTTARIFTIPANASVAYVIGTAITIVNQNAAGVITIAITTDTMRLAGAGTTGSRSLAANGIATILKLTSTEWIISGPGVT